MFVFLRTKIFLFIGKVYPEIIAIRFRNLHNLLRSYKSPVHLKTICIEELRLLSNMKSLKQSRSILLDSLSLIPHTINSLHIYFLISQTDPDIYRSNYII